MIHQKTLTNLVGLIGYQPDTYATGDVAFIYIDRGSMFGCVSCGMFRLHDNFSTSGETEDGVFVLASSVLIDMYWKRIHKGLPDVTSSGTITLANSESVTLTHGSDAGHIRVPSSYLVVVSDVTAKIDLTTEGVSGTTIRSLVDGHYAAVEWVSTEGQVVLSRQIEFVVDQAIALPGNFVSWRTMTQHVADDLLVVPYEGTGVHSGYLAYLRESAGVYSFEERSGYCGSSGYLSESSYTKYSGDRLVGSSTFVLQDGFTALSVYNYNAGNDEWDLEKELYDYGDWAAGAAGWIMTPGGDVHSSVDRTSGAWSTFNVLSENWGIFSSPSYSKYECSPAMNDRYGMAMFWPFCPSSAVTWTDKYGEPWVDAVTPDGGIFASDSIYTIWNKAWPYMPVILPGTFNDGRVAVKKAEYYYHEWSVAEFTRDGEFADLVAGVDQVESLDNLLTENTAYDPAKDYNWMSVKSGGISYESLMFDDGYIYKIGAGKKVARYGRTCDIVVPTSLYDSGVDNDVSARIDPIKGSTSYLWIDSANEKASIVSIQENAVYPTSACIEKSYLDFISDAESIALVTIFSTDVAGSVCRYLFSDEVGALYRWNGANWVSGTHFTGNTKAEFEGANINQALTDIGNKLGICIVLHTDGTSTPIFESIEVSYTRPGDVSLGNKFTDASDYFDVEIVSDTQTSLTNVSGVSQTLNFKVFIFPE